MSMKGEYIRRNTPGRPKSRTPTYVWDRHIQNEDVSSFRPRKSASWEVVMDRALEYGQWKFAKLKRAVQRRRLREGHLKRRGVVDGRVPLHKLMNGLKM